MSAPFTMPERLETERLRLCPWVRRHFEPIAEFNADPVATKFLGGVMTHAEAWRATAAMVGHWALRGYGFYAVELPDGELVGACGVHLPRGWPELELGYDLMPAHQGNGYATEAARAVRDEAARRGMTRLISLIDPRNGPSLAVARRLAAKREGTFILNGEPTGIFVHDMTAGATGEAPAPKKRRKPPQKAAAS